MEKSLKRQIVEATEAVKKKVRKMKDIEINNKEALESVFKPVTEPLNLIANVSKQSAPQNIKDEGTLAGGAAGIAKTVNDYKAAQQNLRETERHNKTMEALALGKGLRSSLRCIVLKG